MKFRGLLAAAAVLAALSATLYWSSHHKPETKAAADAAPAILTLNPADLSQISISRKGQETLTLARIPETHAEKENKSGGLGTGKMGPWQITSPSVLPADQSDVAALVAALSSLMSQRLVDSAVKPDALAEYGLGEPSLQIIVSAANKTYKLLIGDNTPTNSGAYAEIAGDPRVFTIAGFVRKSLDQSAADLRDKRLITIDLPKINHCALETGNQDLEFDRTDNQWQMVKPQLLRTDGSAVESLLSQVTGAKMDVSPTRDERQAEREFAAGSPVATVKVSGDSNSQELQIRRNQVRENQGRENEDQYWAKSSAVPGSYKVSKELGEAVAKKPDDFRSRKLFDFGWNTLGKIEIQDGAKSYFLTRGGEDWWSTDGKKLDDASAESVVDKLSDLQADGFVDSGFTTPAITIRVSPGAPDKNAGQKVVRSETLLISQSGDRYVAKRENEPAMYSLDSSTVEGLRKAASDLKPAAAGRK